MIKHMAADGTLPDDFRDALTPMYAQGLEAEGILANSGWTERFEAMGANKDIALAMAATLPALISGTKGAKGPKNTTTGNGKGPSASEIKPQMLDPKYANDTWKPIKRYQLVQKDGVWYTVGASGSMFRARGTYDFVTINGKIYVSNTKTDPTAGYYDISRGASQVDYAGSVKFGWSDGTRGVLQRFDNSSGHYKPSGSVANQAGLPLDKFSDNFKGNNVK